MFYDTKKVSETILIHKIFCISEKYHIQIKGLSKCHIERSRNAYLLSLRLRKVVQANF